MKKLMIAIGLVSLMAAPVMADYSGGTMNMGKQVGYYGPGFAGEFTMYPNASDPYLSNAAYAAATKNQGVANSFQTFCLELTEHADTPVDINVNERFINEADGSPAGAGSHAVLGSKPFGDNLDQRTAYLYTKFAQGTLAGYDYTPGAGRGASAASLQLAIWVIEEEIPSTSDALALAFIADANNAVASGAWSGIGLVRVLNLSLHGYPRSFRQDVPYLLPVPGAALLVVLGLGLASLRRRRMAQ
ncbi:MAG: hypothetical protein HRF43_06745 [Phycisphaerae bacterium]